MRSLKKYFFLSLLSSLIIPPCPIHSQTKKIDSLLKIISLQKADTIEAEVLKKLGLEYKIVGDFAKAIESEKRCIELYHKLNHLDGEARGYNNLGLIYFDIGNYAEAISCYFLSIKLFEKAKDKPGLALAYNNLGNTYDILENYKDALELHHKSLRIKKEINNLYGVATSYNNIGIIYKKTGAYNQALSNYTEALKLMKQINDEQGIAYITENISIVNVLMAIQNLKSGNKINSDSLFKYAIKLQREALYIKEKIEDNEGIIIAKLNFGTLYTKTNLYDSAFVYLNQALIQSKKIGARDLIADSYRDLSILDSTKGDFQSAYLNFKVYQQCKDSIFNDETKQKTLQSKLQYEFDKKEISMTAEKKQKQLMIYIILGVMLFILSTLLMLYYRYVNIKKQKVIVELQKRQADEALGLADLENTKLKLFNQEAQYKLLQEQINPHFLFNTLETINSLISNTPDLAKEFIYYLSDFLRINIQNNERLVLLKDEINLLNNYKELQTIRFGEAIQIKTNINEANLQTLKTPYFSLLTLVENAIKHNTFTKEKPLVIEISNSNNFIEVTNNLQRKRNMGTTTKTGLTNLNERYKLIVNKEILVVVDEKYFTVKLPYINL